MGSGITICSILFNYFVGCIMQHSSIMFDASCLSPTCSTSHHHEPSSLALWVAKLGPRTLHMARCLLGKHGWSANTVVCCHALKLCIDQNSGVAPGGTWIFTAPPVAPTVMVFTGEALVCGPESRGMYSSHPGSGCG